jgi:AmmeMemoRadiSam system protein B/AmmeMemoRadiSam system protein A
LLWAQLIPLAKADTVKKARFAGAFYPADPGELSRMINGFLEQADPLPFSGEIFALICPHAGYGYSGETAAYGYRLLRGREYKTVVILGVSHQFPLTGASIYPEGVFMTPLGGVSVDNEFTSKLLGRMKEVRFVPEAFDEEHSVEVQIPFLQVVLNDFKIVPIVMGDCSFVTLQNLASLLNEAIGQRKDVLVVVSTDLYHGYDFQELEAVDAVTLGYVKNFDAIGLYRSLVNGGAQMCGGMGVVTALLLANDLGHQKAVVLKHTSSAEVAGRRIKGVWTVGYASCLLDNEKGESQMFTKEQKKALLHLARASLKEYLDSHQKIDVEEDDPSFQQHLGAFVTLREHGELRGCIGNLVSKQPLYATIRDMAVEAGTGDPRFLPVRKDELPSIEIEISVLSPLEKIDDVKKIRLGEHGVLVRSGFHSGVFLPQVASETGWTKEEFLSALCSQKAGLPPDAWKDKSTDLYIFTAEVFSEGDL